MRNCIKGYNIRKIENHWFRPMGPLGGHRDRNMVVVGADGVKGALGADAHMCREHLARSCIPPYPTGMPHDLHGVSSGIYVENHV